MKMQNNDLISSELLENKESEEYFFKSFSILKITEENLVSRTFILFVGIVLGIVGLNVNTVSMMKDAVSVVLNVELTMLGIVFTGYALFQALLNDELLKVMIEVEGSDKKNKLYSSNELFLFLMLQFLVGIFISLLSQFVLNVMPEDFCLWSNRLLSDVVAFILMFCFFVHFMILMWRMVAFISNMFKYFNIHAVTKYLSKQKDDHAE